MHTPSESEKHLIHDSLRGWPTDDYLRKITSVWPKEWFDEAIASAPAVAAMDALPGIISTLRELRAGRLTAKMPFGLGEVLRNFSEKRTGRRRVK